MINLTLVKAIAFKILPYLLVALVLFGIYFYHTSSVKSAYDQGHFDGIAYQVKLQKDADVAAEQSRQADKERLEREAKHEIDQARSDANAARASVDRLREQISRIQRVAQNAAGPESSGASASQAVSLLAKLFQESVDRNGALADFADSSYNAGKLCEASYDSLRKDYASSQSRER